jgi:hypothetical protein
MGTSAVFRQTLISFPCLLRRIAIGQTKKDSVNPRQTSQCQSVQKKSVSISVYVNPCLKNLCLFVWIRGYFCAFCDENNLC